MIVLSKFEQASSVSQKDFEVFLKLLAPLAPFVTEELWERLGNRTSIHKSEWPNHDSRFLIQDSITLIIQVNGKVRDQISVRQGIGVKEAEKAALQQPRIKELVLDKKIKRTVFVKDRLINFVV